MMRAYGRFKFLPLMAVLAMAGCTTESYDTGDGDYSYLTSTFSMLKINSEKQAVSFVTDDDREYSLSSPVEISGAKADTTYRVLAYYNETSSGTTQLRGIRSVYVVSPKMSAEVEKPKTDPVAFDAMWIAANGKYLNLTLRLKTGVENDDDNTSQKLGMLVKKNERTESTAHDSYTLTLMHDQNGVPEYYSTTTYLSVPLEGFNENDTLRVVVNTYDNGVTAKTAVVPAK